MVTKAFYYKYVTLKCADQQETHMLFTQKDTINEQNDTRRWQKDAKI